jgi:hypothetical protein
VEIIGYHPIIICADEGKEAGIKKVDLTEKRHFSVQIERFWTSLSSQKLFKYGILE